MKSLLKKCAIWISKLKTTAINICRQKDLNPEFKSVFEILPLKILILFIESKRLFQKIKLINPNPIIDPINSAMKYQY